MGIVREVSRAGLSEQQQLELGDIAEGLRRVDDMLALARGFGNPHVVMTLEQARHTLLRQCAGAKQMDPAVACAAREVRLEQEAEVRAARARCTAARAPRHAPAHPAALARSSGLELGAICCLGLQDHPPVAP